MRIFAFERGQDARFAKMRSNGVMRRKGGLSLASDDSVVKQHAAEWSLRTGSERFHSTAGRPESNRDEWSFCSEVNEEVRDNKFGFGVTPHAALWPERVFGARL